MRVRSRLLPFLSSKSLLRQAGVYTTSNLASRAIPFLLLPVLTRFLSPTDYGIVAMFLLTALLLDPFISMGLAGAITVKYYDKATSLPAYVGTGIAVVFCAAVPVALLLFLFREPLADITQVPDAWLLLTIPLVVAKAIGGTYLALLRVREKAITFGVAQNLQTAGVLGLSLLFVVVMGRDWRGRLEAELIAWIAFAILALVVLWRSGLFRITFVRSYARNLAKFGIPLIPHTLGGVLIFQTDRLLLTNLVGIDETGLYTVGYQLALVVELVAASFNNAYTPWLYRQLSEVNEEVKRRLVRYTYAQFAIMAVFAGVVAIVMPWLARALLDRRFDGSAAYVGWLALGFFFTAMYYMVANYIFYAQKTAWLAAVTITVAAINIPLTYALIKLNGGIGAAQGTAIALGLSFLFTWIVSQRAYPMPWLRRRSEPSGAKPT